MSGEPVRGLRGFLQSVPGRIALILLAIGVVFGTFVYVATLLAIPAMLLVALALPIWVGLKRPRYLALSGLVVLIAVAPIATIVFSQELLVPPAPASSPDVTPFGSGGSILSGASVSPFQGSTATTFTWTVTIYPKYLDKQYNGTNWTKDTLVLYISTCPGATSTNSSSCSAGYTFIPRTLTFAAPPANGTVETFSYQIGTVGIWDWQMELILANATNATNPARIPLVGDPTYDGIEGPIIGGFGTVYGALIGAIYLDELVYVGIPFYFILILYMWFKNREARTRSAIRAGAKAVIASKAAAGSADPIPPSPPTGGSPPAGSSPGPAAAPKTPAPGEATCPSCGAVVYPNEAKCWKCGVSLSGGPASSGTPLPPG